MADWNGMVDWNAGIEWWNGTVEWNGEILYQTFPTGFTIRKLVTIS